MKFDINASQLRIVFIVTMILITIVGVALFNFAYGNLKTTAKDVSAKAAEAVASQNEIERLQRVKVDLENNKLTASRVADIVAESKSYQYQNQIVNDLNDFASRSGVRITGIDFSEATSGSSTSSSGEAASAATPPPAGAGMEGGGAVATPAPTSSLKAVSATITLDSPMDYLSFLRFINAIEQNLTKMQIQKLGLTSDDGISSESLTIEVYTR